jgi:hypothetical protein
VLVFEQFVCSVSISTTDRGAVYAARTESSDYDSCSAVLFECVLDAVGQQSARFAKICVHTQHILLLESIHYK